MNSDSKKQIRTAYNQLRLYMTTNDILQLFAVKTGERPACLSTVILTNEDYHTISESPRTIQTTPQEAEQVIDTILEDFNLHFESRTKKQRHRTVINYFISNSKQRLTRLRGRMPTSLLVG